MPTNTSNLRGPSEYDISKFSIANSSMSCPSSRDSARLLGKVAGGWQISGSTQFPNRPPCSVGVANDYAGVRESGSFNCQPPTFQQGLWAALGAGGGVRHIGKFAGSTGNGSSPKSFATKRKRNSSLDCAPAGTFDLQKASRQYFCAWPGELDIAMIKAFPIFRENGFEFRARRLQLRGIVPTGLRRTTLPLQPSSGK